MRNLKRAAAIFLAVILALSISVPAFAAVDDTGFSDVDADSWYAEAAVYCRDNGLMSGTSATTFSPDTPMTRAMLAAVLYRLEGSPAVTGSDSFTDTTNGAWYADAVLWASQNGIVSGYGGGLFGTNDPITREQLATILWRYSDSPSADGGSSFADEGTISSWADTAVDWARSNGYINGMEGNRFAPKGQATRAQVAAILMRYDSDTQIPTEPTPDPVDGKNVLVAYFSGTGTTEGVAENLVTALGSDVADLYEITPEEPYTAADLDYTNSNCRSVREQQDPNVRPAISGSVENMAQYDIVFLGYPIWNNDAPRIIYTFLESEELSGKTIIPFCTSGGSGINNSVSNIRGLADDATWLDGRRCNGSDTTATLESWVNSLDLDFTSGDADTAAPQEENKVLVAYFSATNNTEGVAQHIASILDAELYEITPAVPYTSADLDYGDDSSRTTIEMNDPDARPEIAGSVENMEDYNVIFLGYPIWWGDAPRIINTFLESYDFSGKTIVPFCTSNSSGIGSSDRDLHSMANDADWLSGQRFSSGTSEATVENWINGLGLDLEMEAQ